MNTKDISGALEDSQLLIQMQLKRNKRASMSSRSFLISPQPSSLPFVFPQTELFLWLHSIIFQHPTILPHILAFDLQACLWLDRFDHEVIVAERAIFVAVFELLHIFPKALLALLAGKCHLHRLL